MKKDMKNEKIFLLKGKIFFSKVKWFFQNRKEKNAQKLKG